MQEAVTRRLTGFRWKQFRPFVVLLLLLACLHPLPLEGASGVTESFRAGLSFSQTLPLTTGQQEDLLRDLRRLTGYTEIECDDAGFLVLGNREHMAGGSATARALISAAVDGLDAYIIESHSRSPEVAFARIRAQSDYVDSKTAPRLTRHTWTVEMDFNDYGELRGEADAMTAFDPALTLLHELAHAVRHLRDSISETDPLGDCERHINQIRRELGLPERQNYESVNKQAVTPYGTGQRVLGELTFIRSDPGKGTRKSRLTFDVENVFAASAIKPRLANTRVFGGR